MTDQIKPTLNDLYHFPRIGDLHTWYGVNAIVLDIKTKNGKATRIKVLYWCIFDEDYKEEIIEPRGVLLWHVHKNSTTLQTRQRELFMLSGLAARAVANLRMTQDLLKRLDLNPPIGTAYISGAINLINSDIVPRIHQELTELKRQRKPRSKT